VLTRTAGVASQNEGGPVVRVRELLTRLLLHLLWRDGLPIPSPFLSHVKNSFVSTAVTLSSTRQRLATTNEALTERNARLSAMTSSLLLRAQLRLARAQDDKAHALQIEPVDFVQLQHAVVLFVGVKDDLREEWVRAVEPAVRRQEQRVMVASRVTVDGRVVSICTAPWTKKDR
jgi:hypothetical protein